MRKLCWFVFSFTVAIFFAVYFLSEKWIFGFGVFCGLATLGGLFFHGKLRRKILIVCCGLAFGFCWFGFYNMLVRFPARELLDTSPATYTFEVKEFPKATQYGSVSLSVRVVNHENRVYNVLLYAGDEALELCPGDRFIAEVNLSPSDLRKGESYDYYQSKGIFLIGNVNGEIIEVEHSERISLKYIHQWVAKGLQQAIDRIFEEKYVGFFTALFTGDKSLLEDGTYAALRRVGLAHVVAVSGLHIGFISAMFTTFVRRKNLLTILVQIFVLFFFAAVTGNSPSAIRAAFMASALLVAPLLGREEDRLTTLSMILLLLLLECPYSATSISLQLSFTAFLGIILCSENLNSRFLSLLPSLSEKFGKSIQNVWRNLSGVLSVSLGATVFTTPLIAFHYSSVSIVSVVANILGLWAISLGFVLGLIAVLIGFVCSIAGGAIGKLASLPIRWVIFIANSLARLPFASVSLFSVYLIVWFIVAYVIFLIWIFAQERIRLHIPLVALLVTFILTFGIQQSSLQKRKLTVAVLDVGQGSSTVLYSKGDAVLIDCGGNENSVGDIAADYIQFLGTSQLKALVLTHYDEDHTNGVAELMERLEIETVYLPKILFDAEKQKEILSLCEQYGCNVEILYWEDAIVTFGEAELKIYTPLGGKKKNSAGLSVLCSADGFDVLITGDMDMATEHLLLKYKNIPDIELLVVGHHGSKNATSEELLATTTPEIAVISSGYNTYGHPSAEAIKRLTEAGCKIYRTDESGTIAFAVE